MQTLVREAREQIVLGVFKDGRLVPADNTPTFVVINADTEDELSSGTSIPKLDGSGNPTGNYYLIADPETESNPGGHARQVITPVVPIVAE